MASTISFLGTRNLNIFQVALLSVVILVFTGAENREVFRDNNLQIHQSPASIKSYEEGKIESLAARCPKIFKLYDA